LSDLKYYKASMKPGNQEYKKVMTHDDLRRVKISHLSVGNWKDTTINRLTWLASSVDKIKKLKQW